MRWRDALRFTLPALPVLSLAVLAGCGEVALAKWPDGIKRFEGRGAPLREQGSWTYWYPDGERREQGSYENGRRTGVWTQWYRNGQRASRGERVWVPEKHAAERHGPWRFWHENGQLRSEGTFERGKRTGTWRAWHDDGTVDEARSGE